MVLTLVQVTRIVPNESNIVHYSGDELRVIKSTENKTFGIHTVEERVVEMKDVDERWWCFEESQGTFPVQKDQRTGSSYNKKTVVGRSW